MKHKGYSRIFYVEAFILLFFFLAVIVIVSRVLVTAKAESIRARDLTDAVILAENAAEISGSTADPEEIYALFGIERWANGGAEAVLPLTVELRCGREPVYAEDGRYLLTVVWNREEHAAGDLVSAFVRVALYETGEELYTLDTGAWIAAWAAAGGEGGPS